MIVKAFVPAPASIVCGTYSDDNDTPDLHHEGRAVVLELATFSEASFQAFSNLVITADFDYVQRRGNQIYVRTANTPTHRVAHMPPAPPHTHARAYTHTHTAVWYQLPSSPFTDSAIIYHNAPHAHFSASK